MLPNWNIVRARSDRERTINSSIHSLRSGPCRVRLPLFDCLLLLCLPVRSSIVFLCFIKDIFFP